MSDMSAVVWALVGLLAAALGILSTALFAAISRTDNLRASMEVTSDRVDARFERIDQRFERIDQRFERIDERLQRMDERIDRLIADVREIRDLILALDRRLTVAGA